MSILDKKKLKHDYQYSSMPERIPLPVKHFAKKLFNPGKPVSGLSFRTTNWAQKMSKKYEQEIKRPGRKQIQSDTIRFSKPHSMTTYCTERLIQDYSKKKYYRFDDMMVILDPYKQSPLTALAIFYTKKPYRVRYTVMGKTSEADYTVTLEAKQEHRVPILGLYPAYRNKILMELLDDEGNAVKQRTITIGTKELPKGISNIVERKKYSAKPAYDMVMVSGGLHVCTFAFDCNADVRFYLRRKTKAYGIFPLSRGRFLYMEKWIDIPCYTVSQSCMMYEMDYSGRVYKTYFYKKGFHHCAREKEPGGNILLGSNSMEGYEENAVIELDRNTGEVVDYVRLNDYFGDRYNKTTDWVHINAVSYYPQDNSIIVSMRNLHTVVKIDWGSKELKWVLTHPETFKGMEVEDKVLKGVGDVKWFYQQHAAYQLRENLDGNPDTIIIGQSAFLWIGMIMMLNTHI